MLSRVLLSQCSALCLLGRFLSDESSLEYKYYKLKLAESQRLNHSWPIVERRPTPAQCAVRAMLYAQAVRSLKRRLLPWQRRRLLRSQGPRAMKTKRAATAQHISLSSATRQRHHGRQAVGSLQVKPPPRDSSDAAQDCLPESAKPHPQPCSPGALGTSRPIEDDSEVLLASSPCPSADGKCPPHPSCPYAHLYPLEWWEWRSQVLSSLGQVAGWNSQKNLNKMGHDHTVLHVPPKPCWAYVTPPLKVGLGSP